MMLSASKFPGVTANEAVLSHREVVVYMCDSISLPRNDLMVVRVEQSLQSVTLVSISALGEGL